MARTTTTTTMVTNYHPPARRFRSSRDLGESNNRGIRWTRLFFCFEAAKMDFAQTLSSWTNPLPLPRHHHRKYEFKRMKLVSAPLSVLSNDAFVVLEVDGWRIRVLGLIYYIYVGDLLQWQSASGSEPVDL